MATKLNALLGVVNNNEIGIPSTISPFMKLVLAGEFDQDINEWVQKNNSHANIKDTYLKLINPINLKKNENPLLELNEFDKKKIPINLLNDKLTNINKNKMVQIQ